MNILVTYDIKTQDPSGATKLAKMGKILRDYGLRVQNSVWECELYPDEIEEMTRKIKELLTDGDGNVRIYQLSKEWEKKTTQVIGKIPARVSDTLII